MITYDDTNPKMCSMIKNFIESLTVDNIGKLKLNGKLTLMDLIDIYNFQSGSYRTVRNSDLIIDNMIEAFSNYIDFSKYEGQTFYRGTKNKDEIESMDFTNKNFVGHAISVSKSKGIASGFGKYVLNIQFLKGVKFIDLQEFVSSFLNALSFLGVKRIDNNNKNVENTGIDITDNISNARHKTFRDVSKIYNDILYWIEHKDEIKQNLDYYDPIDMRNEQEVLLHSQTYFKIINIDENPDTLKTNISILASGDYETLKNDKNKPVVSTKIKTSSEIFSDKENIDKINKQADECLNKIKNGEPPENVFQFYQKISDDIAIIEINNKYNVLMYNKIYMYHYYYWFDDIYSFEDGYAKVKLNDKYNFINTDGKLVSDQWFDKIYDFYNGYAKVKLNKKWNFINTDGKFISDQWFDEIGYYFQNGYAKVKLNDEWNFINTDGKIISDQWFDEIYNFGYGYAQVRLNKKWNFINTDGKIVSDTWFDYVVNCFYAGYTKVKLNGEDYKMDKNGNLTKPTNESINRFIQNVMSGNDKKSYKLLEEICKEKVKNRINSILKN